MTNFGYRKNRHSCYYLKYHLVVMTKYLHPVLIGPVEHRLSEIAHDIFENNWGCKILELGGKPDHVHIFFEAPPQVQLSKLINNFKTVSSRRLRKEFEEFLRPYYWKPYFWSMSYFISTASEKTEDMVKDYIQAQGNA